MTNNVLEYIMLIYFDYDLKDESLVKVSDLIFILKTDDVKEDLLQLFYMEFYFIFNVAIVINNNEVNDIF